jgi:hypothetical protein
MPGLGLYCGCGDYNYTFRDGKTKDDLIAIIRGQIYRWPESTFNPSKIKKDILKARILENGFTGVFAPLPLQSTSIHIQRHEGPDVF